MRAHALLAFALLAALLSGAPAGAVTVTTPDGSREVFSRGELLDVVELLRLAGVDVAFAPAAGSFAATRDGHDVQFTPGGSLAVVDGKLQALPGPVRVVERRPLAALPTAAALLAPFGWTLQAAAGGLQLAPAGGERLEVSVLSEEDATVVVVRGARLRPRVESAPGVVRLRFPTPVTLAAPVPVSDQVLGGEASDSTLSVRLATGIELLSSYVLENPPRFVLRLGGGVVPGGAPATDGAGRGPLVVLDAGHGGDDQGARGPGGELEKDITLQVARLVAARLQAAGVAARLTRDGDESVSLTDRTATANRLGADVFLSVHANASPARGARGAETYYMSVDASDESASLSAERENAGATGDALQLILWDLAHVANLNSSARLARAVQERLNALQDLRDRGIKQAPFVVLTGATMPSALVEVGFLSNHDEAVRLSSRAGQEELAEALAAAVLEFLRQPENGAPSEERAAAQP